MRGIISAAAAFLFTLVMTPSAQARDPEPRIFPNVTWSYVPICHGYNCRVVVDTSWTAEEREEVKQLFRDHPVGNAEEERHLLKTVMALMETIAGRKSPIYMDKGRNNGGDLPGEMDCLDKSSNVYTYLALLEQEGLLRYHQSTEYAFRMRFIFAQHYSAAIKEMGSGEDWVIDSWFFDFGSQPVIVTVDDWKAGRPH